MAGLPAVVVPAARLTTGAIPAVGLRARVTAAQQGAVRLRRDQHHLIRPEAAPEGLQRDAQRRLDRHRPGQGLQHLPDRFEQPVPHRQLVQQPVPLDRAGGVPGVERGEVQVVAARLARHRAEHGDHAEQPARPEHGHRPGAGDLGRPGQVPEDLPGAAVGPQVVLDDRHLPLGGQPDRPARRPDRQPRPGVEQRVGHPEGRRAHQLAVLEQVDGQALAAEGGAERGQDQRERRRRVGGDEPPGEPVQPGELEARRGVDRLAGNQRHHVVRVHLARQQLRDHPAVPQHHDPVRQPEHQLRVVRRQQDRGAPRAQPGDQPLDERGLPHRERGGRLVEQQDPGVVRHRPRDRHHLPLRAGQHPDRPRGVPQRDAEPVKQQPPRPCAGPPRRTGACGARCRASRSRRCQGCRPAPGPARPRAPRASRRPWGTAPPPGRPP